MIGRVWDMKRKETGSLLATASVLMSLICIMLVLMSLKENSEIAIYNKRLNSFQQEYNLYITVERLLREGSSELTDTAKKFVATGDIKSLEAYFDELDSRKRREIAVSILTEYAAGKDSYLSLVKAKEESDDLAKEEVHALALASLGYGYYDSYEGELPEEIVYYEFEPYERSMGSQELIDMAVKIMFSGGYAKSQNKIYTNAKEFLDMALEETGNQYDEVSASLDASVRKQRVITLVFFLMLLSTIWLMLRVNRKKIKRGEEIEKLKSSLNQKQDELDGALKERDQANKTGTRFLENMSGAIKSPINNIIDMTGHAELNLDDRGVARDYLKRIQGAAQMLLELVNDVLTLGRSEKGMVTVRTDPIDINNFIDSCTDIIDGQISEAGIRFIKDVGLILHPNVRGDELHLRQVILNIVNNAIKSTRPGESITFRIFEEIGTDNDRSTALYHIEIEDTGVGMTEQYKKHIFDDYSKGVDIYEDDVSIGIGMSIARHYVELMGGKISVESELQKGSKFTIDIPFEIYRAETSEAEDEGNRLAGSNILIAEDNELNMEIARKMLVAEGATVMPAENGLIALSLFRSSPENSIDAILMDVAMPMLDGVAATKEIRSSVRNDAKTVPIIAMVAGNAEEDIDLLTEAGMNDYIAKPVDVTQLVKTLLSAMRSQSNMLAERLEKALRDANTDSLTGVKNRNAFDLSTGRIDVEIESGEDAHFSIVICDVNGLKSINDNVGHDEGNKLLINACRLICRTFKRSPVFRIGGDEFVAILRNDDYDNREELVGGLKAKMTAENYKPNDCNNVSFAIGMADFDPSVDSNCSDVFKRADVDMYEHKKSIKGEENIR